jgi:hypothetical protein
MGPEMHLVIPFTIWTLVLTILITVCGLVVDKYLLYHGPEDEEEWNEDNHFVGR